MESMKKFAIFILVLTLFLFSVSTVQAANLNSSISGIQIFPKDYIWNVPIDKLPVDPKSDNYVNSMSDPSAYIYISDMFPINVVDENTTKKYLISCRYTSVCDNVPYPIPDDPAIESISDAHLLIVNKDTNILYEIFEAGQAPDGMWTAGSAVTYNLSSYTLRSDNRFSADAAGLAITPGLITYDEVAAGEINHAIRFAAWRTQNTYVWPARAPGSIANTSYPPFGQRFRLKASFNTSGYSPRAKIIFEAFKKYGLILADNNGDPNTWSVSANADERWYDGYVLFSDMKTLHPSDFEAVNVTSLMINKDSGQARITPNITPTPTPTQIPVTNEKNKIGIYQNGVWYLDTNTNGIFDIGTDKQYNFGATGWTPEKRDWNGDGKTEIGIYQNGVWYLDWNGNGMWDGGTDKQYNFGATGWTSVVGDWNGNGKTEVGVYQNGVWYLDWNGNGAWDAGTDKVYSFGTTAWIPVVGDWNGDGKGTKIGIYQNGVWYLDWNGNGMWDADTDKVYLFGATGWTSIVGDWNGDGKGTKIGLHKDGIWYLDWNGNGSWDAGTDKVYSFGATAWIPVIGDWNGDGKGTQIGVYKEGVWYLDWNGNGAWDAGTDKVYSFGAAGWTPVIGK